MPKAPIGLWAGIHLGKKSYTYVGKGPRADQVWKKTPDNWPRVNKNPKELSHINDLTSSLLCSSSLPGRSHPFISALLCLNYRNCVCVLSHLLCCVFNDRLCFYSLCHLEKCNFHGGQGPGELCFYPLAPGGLAARSPGFSSRLPRFNSWAGN